MSDYKNQVFMEGLLKSESMPAIIKETIAFGVSEYGTSLIELLVERKGQVCYSINDISCRYWPSFKSVNDVVELSNPYAERDFSIISFTDFSKIVESLMNGKETDLGVSLFENSAVRTDFDESRGYW